MNSQYYIRNFTNISYKSIIKSFSRNQQQHFKRINRKNYSAVGDDFMIGTVKRCWWQNHYAVYLFCEENLSPTS